MINPSMLTARLKLVPHNPAALLALQESAEEFARLSGYPAAEGLRDMFGSEEVSPEWRAQLKTATKPDPWKFGFALVHLASNSVIGAGGFTGAPDADGEVELAYGIVPSYEGQGYGTEAAEALLAYAIDSGQVKVVRAHTLPQLNASARILTKCGFQRAGEAQDHFAGTVWRWEKRLA